MTNRTLTKYAIVALTINAFCHAKALTPVFEGNTAAAVHIDADVSTGLDGGVFVIPSTSGVTASCRLSGTGAATVFRFSNLGAAYEEQIASTTDGDNVSFSLENSDMGYVVEQGTSRNYFWVVDYSRHQLRLDALDYAPDASDCDRIALTLTGDASEIAYYTINGRRMVLSRELQLAYTTLAFDENTFSYTPATAVETLDAVGATLHATAPLCNTTFTLSGDRFLTAWHQGESVTSPLVTPTAVAATSRATQAARDADNEQRGDSDALGGSAPCDITFEAAVTDAAIFTEWQISRDASFDNVDNTFPELTIDYTFRDNGITYARFVANNADGTCEVIGDTYTINIGESKLEVPNAFSPEASPGVNDEWKVSYKSIISYQCHIFNRWGKQLFASTNPAEGWDGRSGGKFVPAGVYFYVIKAVGADGVKYDLAGDINIIKFKTSQTSSSDNESEQ